MFETLDEAIEALAVCDATLSQLRNELILAGEDDVLAELNATTEAMDTLADRLIALNDEDTEDEDEDEAIDPTYCTPDAPACENCGRGLSHDEECPDENGGAR